MHEVPQCHLMVGYAIRGRRVDVDEAVPATFAKFAVSGRQHV